MLNVKKYGIRNGYLMAVAPNSSTSVIAGSTASIDPILKPFYYEEKKDYKLPVVAPDLTIEHMIFIGDPHILSINAGQLSKMQRALAILINQFHLIFMYRIQLKRKFYWTYTYKLGNQG